MIKVTVLYPNEEGKKFDHAYFSTTHQALVQKLLTPMGLIKFETEKGVSSADPNEPAPFIAVGQLSFNTTEEVHEGFKAHGGEMGGRKVRPRLLFYHPLRLGPKTVDPDGPG